MFRQFFAETYGLDSKVSRQRCWLVQQLRSRSLLIGTVASMLAHLLAILVFTHGHHAIEQNAALAGVLTVAVVDEVGLGSPLAAPVAPAVTVKERPVAPVRKRAPRFAASAPALTTAAPIDPPALRWSETDIVPPPLSESEQPAPSEDPLSAAGVSGVDAETTLTADEQAPVAAAPFGGATDDATHATRPSFVSPGIAKELRVYDDFPSLPDAMKHAGGLAQAVDVEVCVSDRGSVSDVTLDNRPGRPLEDALRTAIRTWRYRPLLVRGAATPFCHAMQIRYVTN